MHNLSERVPSYSNHPYFDLSQTSYGIVVQHRSINCISNLDVGSIFVEVRANPY